MATIDTRVVEMNFDNSKFGSGVEKTLSMLDRLKGALGLNGASKGLQDVNAAAQNFNSAPMEQGVGRIAGQFTALQAIAFGALANIGAKISSVAMNMASQFSTGPIIAGFQEYELKMGSIQTILANTQRHGTGLDQVTASLDSLNHYADKTIYNFGDMTKNIGLFTNAGIKVEDASTMIMGFSNAAAASGTSAEGAAGAAYQLSQALSAGKVTLMDWRSLQNVGMGNKNMQQGIIEIAEAMGTMEGKGVTAASVTKDFNGSLEKGWLTADVMSTYLKAMSGEMDDASLAALGLDAASVKLLRDQATMGEDAATKVRTFTQLMGTMKESVGSGWSETFGLVIGDFNEATDLFTSINNATSAFIGRTSDARNEMLKTWKDNGGRTAAIEGLTDAFWLLGAPLAQVGMAFRDVFPAMTGERLAELTKSFAELMAEIQPSPETLERLRRTFAGVFAVLHIGWTILKAVATFFIDLLRGVTEGDQGILKFTASIGDFLVGLDKALTSGDGLTQFFAKLRDKIFQVINPIRDAGQAFGNFFDGFDLSVEGGQLGGFLDKLLSLSWLGNAVGAVFGKLGDIFSGVKDAIGGLADKIGEFFSNLGGGFSSGFEFNPETFLRALQLGLGAGVLVILNGLRKAISDFSIFGDAGGGFLDSIKDTIGGINDALEGVTGVLEGMQANLRANALIKIAAAIGILALAMLVLAGIDAPGLVRASAAMAVMFVQLGIALKTLEGIGTGGGAIKFAVMSVGLIGLAAAMLLLAFAVKKLSEIEFPDLLRGLLAMNIMLKALTRAVQGMSGQSAGMVRTGASLILLAIAVRILVGAVKDLADMGWEDLAKGIGGVAVLLGALALFTKFAEADSGGIKQGLGLILLGVALKVLASAIADFAQYNWEELSQGIVGIGAGLAVIAGAMRLMPDNVLFKAASIAIVGYSLGLVADAVKQMSGMSWAETAQGLLTMTIALRAISGAIAALPEGAIFSAAAIFVAAAALGLIADALVVMGGMSFGEMAQGLIGMSISLKIIGGALESMVRALPGAAALIVATLALKMLFPVIQGFAAMSWGEMIQGLLGLAGVFVVLGIAGFVLAPVTLVLLGLGAAILLLGTGVILAAAGVLLFSTALTALAVAGAAGTAAIVAIVSGLIGLIPLVAEQIGLGIIAFANVIATSGPAILGAITAVLNAFLQAIIDVTPKVVEALLTLLFNFLTVLDQAIPRIIQTGINLLMALLDGIGRNIGQIVDKAVTIIVNFVNAIANNLPRVIQAGVNLIIALMNGIGNAARDNGPAIADAAANMATGIIDGIVSGIRRLGSRFKDALLNLASQAWEGIKDFFGIGSPSKLMIWMSRMNVEGMTIGIKKYGHNAVDATEGMGHDIVNTLGKTISGLGDLIGGDVDMKPVIAPVLDLSEVRKGAAGIGTLLDAAPLDVGASFSGAANASAGYRANQAALEESEADSGGEGITFVQNNYSPKAISPAETYRNTRSQLSLAKEELKSNAS